MLMQYVLLQTTQITKCSCNIYFGQLNTHKVQTSNESLPVFWSVLSSAEKLSELPGCTFLFKISELVCGTLCVQWMQSFPLNHILDECCKWCLTVEHPKEYCCTCCGLISDKGNSQK